MAFTKLCFAVVASAYMLRDWAPTAAAAAADSAVCAAALSCGECMSNADCFWCSDSADEMLGRPRCASRRDALLWAECLSKEDVASSSVVEADRPPDASSGAVLIAPQKAALRLRPFHGERLEFEIVQSDLTPVDMYFLLDLSWSMRTSRDTIARQGASIINTLKEFTNDLHIGIGSFVEKGLPPFTSAVYEFNCPAKNPNCMPPYSFYHQTSLQSLTADHFHDELMRAPLAGNVDIPESSLDGLLQCMVCEERVGWRSNARKIILLMTDGEYHFALDGKLAGILHPSDGACHLNGSLGQPGYYDRADYFDYPSISHINSATHEGPFTLIFAVKDYLQPIWKALSDLLPGASTAILETDANNIVDIIKNKTRQMTSTITATMSGVPEELISVRFRNGSGYGNSYSDVKFGELVTFVAEVRAKKCFEGSRTFQISPQGIDQSLDVSVETICECECEQEGHHEAQSADCNSQGDLRCGLCFCAPGWIGKSCECEVNSFEKEDDLRASCEDPELASQVCNGRGSCVCGDCICDDAPAVYGQYCQCDDVSCIRDSSGSLCSGHGLCACDSCQCEAGWTGGDCSCSLATDACFSPYNNQPCSANGECVCNACECGAATAGGGQLAHGKRCELQPGEQAPCAVVRECAECAFFGSGALRGHGESGGPAGGCAASSCSRLAFLEVSEENATDALAALGACEATNEAGCSYRYSVLLLDAGAGAAGEDPLAVLYLRVVDGEREQCPKSNAAAISAVIFGLVLLLGLLAVGVYKLLIVIADRRQYAKFVKEAELARYAANQNANDLYKSPITNFENPMYGKAVN